MIKEDLVLKVISLLNEFLNENVNAKDMVVQYNDLIVDNLDWDSNDKKLIVIGEFQDELANYVENPEWRKEHDCYYGPEILWEKVTLFVKQLQS